MNDGIGRTCWSKIHDLKFIESSILEDKLERSKIKSIRREHEITFTVSKNSQNSTWLQSQTIWIHENACCCSILSWSSLAIIIGSAYINCYLFYMHASANEWTNGDKKKWRLKWPRRPLLFIYLYWICNGLARVHLFFLFVFLCHSFSLTTIAFRSTCWYIHLALEFTLATNETLKILCVCIWLWLHWTMAAKVKTILDARTDTIRMALVFTIKRINTVLNLVLKPIFVIRKSETDAKHTRAHIYGIELKSNRFIMRALFRVKFKLIWFDLIRNSLKLFFLHNFIFLWS